MAQSKSNKPLTRAATVGLLVGALPVQLLIVIFLSRDGCSSLEGGKTTKQNTTIQQPEKEEPFDPIHLEMLKEAERRSAQDFHSTGIDAAYLGLFELAQRKSKEQYEKKIKDAYGERGVVIGPTAGPNFKRHGMRVLKNGRRIRNIIQGTNLTGKVRLAWMATPEHIAELDLCLDDNNETVKNSKQHMEMCELWGNNTIFDDVVSTKSLPLNSTSSKDEIVRQYKIHYLQSLVHAPYIDNFFLDSDAYPCPGFETLFHLVDLKMATPGNKFGKLWQLPVAKPADLAIGIEQFNSATVANRLPVPGDPNVLKDYREFVMRNSGSFLLSFQRPTGYTFVQFLSLLVDYVAYTMKIQVQRDQHYLRTALYLIRRLEPNFVEHQIPMHASCRTYPGKSFAGTDGFINGMYPLQQDGTHCKECYCTPCLINHLASTYFVNLLGQKGWEKDFQWKSGRELFGQ